MPVTAPVTAVQQSFCLSEHQVLFAPSRVPAVDMGRKRRDMEAADATGTANVKAAGAAMSKGRQQNSKRQKSTPALTPEKNLEVKHAASQTVAGHLWKHVASQTEEKRLQALAKPSQLTLVAAFTKVQTDMEPPHSATEMPDGHVAGPAASIELPDGSVHALPRIGGSIDCLPEVDCPQLEVSSHRQEAAGSRQQETEASLGIAQPVVGKAHGFFEISYMLDGVPKLFALVDVYTRISSTSWSSNDAQVMLLSLSAFKGTLSYVGDERGNVCPLLPNFW